MENVRKTTVLNLNRIEGDASASGLH